VPEARRNRFVYHLCQASARAEAKPAPPSSRHDLEANFLNGEDCSNRSGARGTTTNSWGRSFPRRKDDLVFSSLTGSSDAVRFPSEAFFRAVPWVAQDFPIGAPTGTSRKLGKTRRDRKCRVFSVYDSDCRPGKSHFENERHCRLPNREGEFFDATCCRTSIGGGAAIWPRPEFATRINSQISRFTNLIDKKTETNRLSSFRGRMSQSWHWERPHYPGKGCDNSRPPRNEPARLHPVNAEMPFAIVRSLKVLDPRAQAGPISLSQLMSATSRGEQASCHQRQFCGGRNPWPQ